MLILTYNRWLLLNWYCLKATIANSTRLGFSDGRIVFYWSHSLSLWNLPPTSVFVASPLLLAHSKLMLLLLLILLNFRLIESAVWYCFTLIIVKLLLLLSSYYSSCDNPIIYVWYVDAHRRTLCSKGSTLTHAIRVAMLFYEINDLLCMRLTEKWLSGAQDYIKILSVI